MVEVTLTLTGLSSSVIFLVHVAIVVSSPPVEKAALAKDFVGRAVNFSILLRCMPNERTDLHRKEDIVNIKASKRTMCINNLVKVSPEKVNAM